MIFGLLSPLSALTHLFAHPFMVNAYLAGTAIAICSGLVGYFLVLRRQVFAGDALTHVAFTGSLIALVIGLDLRLGLYAACILVGLAMAAISPLGRADDVVIGCVFAFVLGIGVLFLSIFTRSRSGGNATGGTSILFGSIFGLSQANTLFSILVAAGIVFALAVIARPLLFATLDEAVASARGVPVRSLGFAFLGLVGVTAAEATQAVGALLLLGLLAAPAGAASRLAVRPWRGMLASVVIAVASTWIGLALAYAFPELPPSFAILALATATYVGALIFTPRALRRRRFPATSSLPGAAETV